MSKADLQRRLAEAQMPCMACFETGDAVEGVDSSRYEICISSLRG